MVKQSKNQQTASAQRMQYVELDNCKECGDDGKLSKVETYRINLWFKGDAGDTILARIKLCKNCFKFYKSKPNELFIKEGA